MSSASSPTRLLLPLLLTAALPSCAHTQRDPDATHARGGGADCSALRSRLPDLVPTVATDTLVGTYEASELRAYGGYALTLRPDGTVHEVSRLCAVGRCTDPEVLRGRWEAAGGEVVVAMEGGGRRVYLVRRGPGEYWLVPVRRVGEVCEPAALSLTPVR